MEIGSKEHKALLLNNIIKMSIKTAGLGLAMGIFLILPSLLVLNRFSTGLAYAGQAIIVISLIYALSIAFKKWRAVRHSFTNNE